MDYPQGIKFPFRIQPAGGVGLVNSGMKITSNLHALILTFVNERLIYKDVGTVGYMAVLRTNSMVGLLRHLIEEAITSFEPRAARVRVEVIPREESGTQRVYVKVSYVFTLSGEMVYSELRLI
jgi:hypothetical protein